MNAFRKKSAAGVGVSLALVSGLIVGCNSPSPTVPSSPVIIMAVTSVTPTSGLAGTVVSINGRGFEPGATVTMDGAPADATFVSSTLVSAKAPVHPDGLVAVVVTNPGGGSAMLATGFIYVTPAVIAVTSVSPTAGLAGDRVLVFGKTFGPGATLSIGGVQSAYGYFDTNCAGTPLGSDRCFEKLAPDHAAGPVDVVMSENGQTSTLPGAFTYQEVTLSVSVNNVTTGDALTVTWDGPFRRADFYEIGLFEVSSNAPVWNVTRSVRPPGRVISGSETLTAPTQPGRYEFRQHFMFDDVGTEYFFIRGRSTVVTVTSPTTLEAAFRTVFVVAPPRPLRQRR